VPILKKDIKLNIKNIQIADALKKFNKKSLLSKKKADKKKQVPPQKRKARILPPEEEAKIETKKEIITKPKKEKVKKPKEVIEKEKLPEKVEQELSPKTEELEPKRPILKKEEKEKEEEYLKKPHKFKDIKALKRPETYRAFDTRDRLGLRTFEEERWRKKRFKQKKIKEAPPTIRPSSLKVKIPISIKDLAQAMKLKASEIIQKLFLQGIVVTINDYLDDETTIQLLGHDFNCEITIDVAEEKRLMITEEDIKTEIANTPKESLEKRPPVITFMGHVDHGKTSLIDAIRNSNLAAIETGMITQHIGAFITKTKYETITILDTPGHEAFSQMRSRGANVTDIVVLVIAGNEGIKEQTLEAINQAKKANVPIIVAINKSDKKDFDAEKIYRELSDHDLLPEAWGGTTITVNCSAKTHAGINELLEMISLQAEILELKANPSIRARGTILESQMHKGLGAIANILVQNGTLKLSDAIVFSDKWGSIKTMHDQYNNAIKSASPSTPVKITGLSDLADAGSEFIVVENEKIAKELAKARSEKMRLSPIQPTKKFTLETLAKNRKKVLPIILRADVQGSLEALKTSLLKIDSKKVDLNIINEEVGEISESDIRLAYASKAIILGFHTKIESHAEYYIKQLKVIVRLHDIIYHAVDEVKELMKSTLDKIEQHVDIGKAKVLALFKSSQLGTIAGCLIIDGIVKRNSHARIIRDGNEILKTKIISLKKVKEDVKEVSKGSECGILLEQSFDIQQNDILEVYDINYLEQVL